jgi:putative DNA primase/helicase
VTIEYQRADPVKLRANLPKDMQEIPAWLVWKQGPPKKDGEKPQKIPYYANGKPRGVTDTKADRSRLVTFDEAMDVYGRDREAYMGPGFALGKVPPSEVPESGIDLDNCVRNGVITPKAMRVVDAADGSYTEFSPSSTGIKIFGVGDIDKEATPELEIYSSGRFFTVTGDRVSGDHRANLVAAAAVARELMLQHDAKAQRKQSALHADARPGSRNNTLYSLACALRARNVDEATAWKALQARNAELSPPLDGRELHQLFKSAWSHAAGFPLTDLGNAERLVAAHGVGIRYLTGGWYTYERHRYAEDRGRRIVILAGESARSIYAEAAAADDADRRKQLASWAQQSESRGRIDNAVSLAGPRVSEPLEDYDANPLLIGLQNGVYDLERDEFRDGRPDDRITLAMNVEYAVKAACPRWQKFQLEIHGGDADMVAFKRRAWGYTLSADTSEQKLFMCFGEGANGKTTEQNVVLDLQGEYGRKIEPDTLLVRNRGGARNDIARIRGARFIATVEVEDGGRLAESLVKQLTGRDRLAARFLYREHFEFKPTGKIWIATNHRPEVAGTDYAIWRRILLIPYQVRFEGKQLDAHLEEKLLAERAGIFNWMLAGYREWRRIGLKAPDSVIGATEDYRANMDRVGNFLRECCRYGDGVTEFTPAGHVYFAYEEWMKANGMKAVSAPKFHARMERDHKLHRVKRNVVGYPNLTVLGA